MMNGRQGSIHNTSEGGVSGKHPDADPLQFLLGTSTTDQFNTLQLPLRPAFCWKVEDIRFEFDSSFVTFNTDGSPGPATNPSDPTSDPIAAPQKKSDDIRDELKILAGLVNKNKGCPLSVFGHADPVGPAVDPDGYNKALSGRRATAIYALLISGTQLQTAVGLWQQIANEEHWGNNQRNVMQQATSLPAGTAMGTLISSYLPKICPPELKLGPQDFLAQGAGSDGKGDYQGCSSFNPLIIFSQAKEDSFAAGKNDQDQTVYDARNLANAPNRRVLVLIFPKGSKVDPDKWPCPSVKGDKSGCIKRFWSDGQARRSNRLPYEDRRFDETQDTFGCRFYHRLTDKSPCEVPPPPDPCTQKTFPARPVDKPISETISNATNPKWNGTYGWHSKYSVAVNRTNCSVTVTIKIKVVGDITDDQKSAWKSAVESKWNDKVKFVCTDPACKAACPDGYAVSVVLEFVTSGEHYPVTANQPGSGGTEGLNGTNGMQGWGVDDTVDITHEFGHMLGNPEEYFTTNGVDYTYGGTKQGYRDADGGIMNNPANNPLPRNYDLIRDEVAAAMGTGITCTTNDATAPAANAPQK
jgi:hypothetical protein